MKIGIEIEVVGEMLKNENKRDKVYKIKDMYLVRELISYLQTE